MLDSEVPGVHDVTGEEGGVIREAVGCPAQNQIRMRHEHLLGLCALERSRDLSVAEYPLVLAVVEQPTPAEEALAARRHERADHAVALGHAVDRVAGGGHGPDEFRGRS